MSRITKTLTRVGRWFQGIGVQIKEGLGQISKKNPLGSKGGRGEGGRGGHFYFW